MKRLAIITTHPIQYNAPFFKCLTERGVIQIKVFYTWSQLQVEEKYDPGFQQNIKWDLPLLDGYDSCFVNNTSSSAGSHHFRGINNPTLIKEIEIWNPDAVFVYGWNFKSHLKVIRHFKNKKPVLFRGDSTLLDEQIGVKKILRRLFLKFIFSFIDIALYTGEANKAYFEAHGIKENAMFFMPHAIDNNRFFVSKKTEDDALSFREGIGIPANALVFLFAGKLESKKQPDVLVDAFLAINNPQTYLIIAGSGELEELIKAKTKNKSNIKLIGFQNQLFMPILYASCNVFVLPSRGPNETWGLSINEAMAAGKAIIVSDACGASYDLVKNKKNGLIFNKNKVNSLKESLQYFMDDIALANKMGRESLERIKNYTYEHDCIALETLLSKIKIVKKP
jgi:glycosyltransferase involved in cell wall biosynthesis